LTTYRVDYKNVNPGYREPSADRLGCQVDFRLQKHGDAVGHLKLLDAQLSLLL
jgi:hypothetical protein